MALTATIDKTRKDLEKTLTDATPLFAFVGVGDLAVEKLREAGAGLNARAVELNARASKLDAKALRTQAKTRVDAVQAEVLPTPDQVKALPAKAQAVVGDYVSTALSAYDDLAGRGKNLVTRIRKQQATEDFQHQVKSTTSRAKATSTTAKKSAARTKSAAKSASTTAKKQAKATKTSAKSTTTAAKKSAQAAATATGDAATKVGD